MRKIFFIFMIGLPLLLTGNDFKTIYFQSKDSLQITADLYMPHKDSAPLILLFHRAHWSRGEYQEIAPKLNKMGFNCLAVDLRSGIQVNDVSNETAKKAKEANKTITYIDALPDMEAALKYVKGKMAKGKIIIWGSSYSAALCFVMAAKYPDQIDGLLAFAPGEYFTPMGKPKDYIASNAKKVSCPVYITSAKLEHNNWEPIFEALPGSDKVYFLPATEGVHGSQALWKSTKESGGYWKTTREFLLRFIDN